MYVAYLLCYPDSTPFYAGAGKAGREYLLNKRNSRCVEVMKKIRAAGQDVLSIILEYDEEEAAFAQELEWIEKYRRIDDGGILTNRVVGRSGGILGIKRDEANREHMRKIMTGTKHSAETRAKMSVSKIGNKNRQGYVYSPEERKLRAEQTRRGIARARERRMKEKT